MTNAFEMRRQVVRYFSGRGCQRRKDNDERELFASGKYFKIFFIHITYWYMTNCHVPKDKNNNKHIFYYFGLNNYFCCIFCCVIGI